MSPLSSRGWPRHKAPNSPFYLRNPGSLVPVATGLVLSLALLVPNLVFAPIAVAAAYACVYLSTRPDVLIRVLLVAVPALPAIPVGAIEISSLDFCAAASALYLLINPHQRPAPRTTPILRWATFYFVTVLTSLIWTLGTPNSVGPWLRALRMAEILLPMAVAARLRWTKRDYESLLRCFLAGVAVGALVGVIMFALRLTASSYTQTVLIGGVEVRRAAGFFKEAVSFGNIAASSLLIVILSRTRGERSLWPPVLHFPLIGVLVVALLASFSRGAIVLLLVGIVVALTLRHRDLPSRQIVSGVLAMGASTVVLGLIAIKILGADFVAEFQAGFLDRLRTLYLLTSNVNEATSGRISTWHHVVALWSENPFTGLGFKSLYLMREVPPDSNYLSVLVEQGIAGFTAFAGLLIVLLRGARQVRGTPGLTAHGTVLVSLWLGQMTQMLSADVLTFWRSIPCYLLFTVTALAIAQEAPTAPP